MRMPAIGDRVVVVYADHEREINGTRRHPAVVTRVWSPTVLNLRAITDGAGIDWLPSVPHASLADAGARRWHWPEEPA